jgi:hypothetical protein
MTPRMVDKPHTRPRPTQNNTNKIRAHRHGHLAWWISPSQGHYLHRVYKQNTCTPTSMSMNGIPDQTPAYYRAKTIPALDGATTVISPMLRPTIHYLHHTACHKKIYICQKSFVVVFSHVWLVLYPPVLQQKSGMHFIIHTIHVVPKIL